MAGPISQAQLDRIPASELAITSSAEPVDGGNARGRKRISVSSAASPSPRPLPGGEGESSAALSPFQSASRLVPARGALFPLPAGEGQGQGERDAAKPRRPDECCKLNSTGSPPQSWLSLRAQSLSMAETRGRKRISVSTAASSSPRPLPGGEGECFAAVECRFAILSSIPRIHQ